ncbi:hypothetical protein SEA_RIZWANA_40 [Arthrobacter phage Rizwana]|nr:hypothetical protein SEA_RIZWANA_40 [Arthrobacter phage Rizwana]
MAEVGQRIVYRVIGRTEDGEAVVRDALTKQLARDVAERLFNYRSKKIVEVTICPSRPVEFLYAKGKPCARKAPVLQGPVLAAIHLAPVRGEAQPPADQGR